MEVPGRCACGGQRATLGAFFYNYPPYSWRYDIPLNMEITNTARLAWEQALRLCLFKPPQC